MTALADALVDGGYDAAETLGRRYLRLTGKVVPWNQPEIVGGYIEEFRRGAFTRSLTRQPRIPLLPFHDRTAIPVGTSEAWQDEPGGLYGIFKVHMHAAAQVAADYAERGIVSGLSIGFVTEANEWRYAATYNPDAGVDGLDRVVRTRGRLVEVSLVSTPAYVDAVVTGVEYTAPNGQRSAGDTAGPVIHRKYPTVIAGRR